MAMSSKYEKREFPQDPPLVAGLTGICNTITKHIIHREMGFFNPINSVYSSMLFRQKKPYKVTPKHYCQNSSLSKFKIGTQFQFFKS